MGQRNGRGLRWLGWLVWIATLGCSCGTEAPPKKSGDKASGALVATCALDEVREYYCDGLLPMSTARGAPAPYEACPAGIEAPEGAYPRREHVARFDEAYTEWARRRAQPGHTCCYSWCAKLQVASAKDVAPYAGCDQAGVMRENYCFPELESGTSDPGPGELTRCPLAIRPPEASSFFVPKAAPLDISETNARRQRSDLACCYGWCSYVPASAR